MRARGLRPAAGPVAALTILTACTATPVAGPSASPTPVPVVTASPASADTPTVTAPSASEDGAAGADATPGVVSAVVAGRYPIELGVEISGLAAARVVDGLWLVDDEPRTDVVHLVAVDGRHRATVRLLDVATINIEDLAVGPCPGASPADDAPTCVHVADIGDNVGGRGDVTVISFPEEAVVGVTDGSTVEVAPDVRRLAYDTAPVDAESLVVTPDGGVVVIDKTPEEAGVHVAGPGETVLRRSATLPLPEPGNRMLAQVVGHTATAADLSADGTVLALRTYDQLALLRHPEGAALDGVEAATDLPDWTVEDLGRVSGELQGEAVALLADGRVVTVAEGSTAITVTTPPTAG